MDEYVNVQFLREEEFLEVHYETVDALLGVLGQDWKPNYQCNDEVRERRGVLRATGQLEELVFEAGVISHHKGMMSSIGIYLHSSTRFLVARVHWVERTQRSRFCATTGGRRSDDGLARDASRSRIIRTRSSISYAAANGREEEAKTQGVGGGVHALWRRVLLLRSVTAKGFAALDQKVWRRAEEPDPTAVDRWPPGVASRLSPRC
jgi:hypothetical protein